jgi:hypothetical protein
VRLKYVHGWNPKTHLWNGYWFKEPPKGVWFDWFAWYPVKVHRGTEWVWLETIEVFIDPKFPRIVSRRRKEKGDNVVEYTRSVKVTFERDTNKQTTEHEWDDVVDAVVDLLDEIDHDDRFDLFGRMQSMYCIECGHEQGECSCEKQKT